RAGHRAVLPRRAPYPRPGRSAAHELRGEVPGGGTGYLRGPLCQMIVVDRRRRDEAADGVDEVRIAAHARAHPPRQARVAAGTAPTSAEMREPGVGIAAEALDEGVVAEEVGDRRGGARRHRHDV